jgi:hypothetical protein
VDPVQLRAMIAGYEMRIAAEPIPGRSREMAELSVDLLPDDLKREALIQLLLRIED